MELAGAHIMKVQVCSKSLLKEETYAHGKIRVSGRMHDHTHTHTYTHTHAHILTASDQGAQTEQASESGSEPGSSRNHHPHH